MVSVSSLLKNIFLLLKSGLTTIHFFFKRKCLWKIASLIFLNVFWRWKMWVSFSRVIFFSSFSFLGLLALAHKPNDHEGKKKKEIKINPKPHPLFVVFLFLVSHNILNTWKKICKNSVLLQIEWTIFSFQQIKNPMIQRACRVLRGLSSSTGIGNTN